MKESSNTTVSPIDVSTRDIDVWTRKRPALGMSLMDHLYNKFGGMYPGRWFACFKDEVSIECWRREWVDAFMDEGITPDHIMPGIKQCRKMFDWPPSIPEFIKACKAAVPPQAHREYPKQIEHRHTPEERAANLKRTQEILAGMKNRVTTE